MVLKRNARAEARPADSTAGSTWREYAEALVMAVLLSAGIRGGILVGILAVTIACWSFGLSPAPESLFTLPQLPQKTLLALDVVA